MLSYTHASKILSRPQKSTTSPHRVGPPLTKESLPNSPRRRVTQLAADRKTIQTMRWLAHLSNSVSCESHLPRILLTQPCETRSWRLMSHGRTPLCESSTIFRRMGSGSGRPLTNSPPSWLTPPWPFEPFPMSEAAASITRKRYVVRRKLAESDK